MHGGATAPALHDVEDPPLCGGPWFRAATAAIALVLDDQLVNASAERRHCIGYDLKPFARADELSVVDPEGPR